MSDHVALALSVLAEIAADPTAPASARVQAAGLLLAHRGAGADDPTLVRFAFSLADGEQPDLEE
jgi:hypothetical protein